MSVAIDASPTPALPEAPRPAGNKPAPDQDFRHLVQRPDQPRGERRVASRPAGLNQNAAGVAGPQRGPSQAGAGAPERRAAGSSPADASEFDDGSLDFKGRRGLPAELEALRTRFDSADPIVRLQLCTASSGPSAPPVAAGAPLAANLPDLVMRLVRRVAWGGDGRRATVRLELGAGGLTGATLVVTAIERTVSVELELPPGVPPEPWQKRISERLTARGLELDEVIVR